MFLSPIRPTDSENRKAWDNLTLYDQGSFYAFFNTIAIGAQPPGHGYALDIAASSDGVHWQFVGRDLVPVEGSHAGYGLLRVGDRIYYYPTATRGSDDTHFKVFASTDYINWEHMGDEYDVRPDPRYYRARWEEICILEDEERGRSVYYGYLSAEVREEVSAPSLGVVKSNDGLHWEVLPPPSLDWGELPAQHMEVCFCEKIEGRYYLVLGGRLYLDSYGYSLYTFVGDDPLGPFAPDLPAFRLTGTSRRDVTWLGHPIHTPEGILLALWHSARQEPEIPSRNLSVGPFKRLVTENGHLRLRYWEGNEAAKGVTVEIGPDILRWEYPARSNRGERDAVEAREDGAHLHAGRDGVVVMVDRRFSAETGFALEGCLQALEHRGAIATHQHAASAGFFLESGDGRGYAIIADTLGVTRGGRLRYADSRITDQDIYAEAGTYLVRTRSGELRGTCSFEYDDQVGPLGHAPFCGIRHGTAHDFRLVARGEFVELYIDDYYVQTYLLPLEFTGRVGLLCLDGRCSYRNLRGWDLDL